MIQERYAAAAARHPLAWPLLKVVWALGEAGLALERLVGRAAAASELRAALGRAAAGLDAAVDDIAAAMTHAVLDAVESEDPARRRP